MDEMKYDMCGGAAVLGVIKAVAELGLPLNVAFGGIQFAQDGGFGGAGLGMPLGRGAPAGQERERKVLV